RERAHGIGSWRWRSCWTRDLTGSSERIREQPSDGEFKVSAGQSEDILRQMLEDTADSRRAADFLAALASEAHEEMSALDAMEYPPEVLLRVAVLARSRVHDVLEHELDDADLLAFARGAMPLERACKIAVHCARSETSERQLRAF